MKKRKILSLLLTGLLTVSTMITPPPAVAAAQDVDGKINQSGNSATSTVELTAAAAHFSVTVPTVLPVNMAADGTITVSEENKIINNGSGPVEVIGVTIEPVNDWTLKEMSENYSSMKVGSKNFGFNLQNADVPTTGICDISNFDIIPAKQGEVSGELDFTYNSKVAPQPEAITEVMANAVFVVGWAMEPPTIIAEGVESGTTTDYAISRGQSVQLTVEDTSEGTWSSNNETVMSVTEDGVATAGEPGIATISYESETLETETTFEVLDAPVTGYTIKALEDVMNEDGEIELELGDQVQLEAVATYSADTPTWASTDSEIASVTESGLLTAESIGETTVTYTNGELSATMAVNVVEPAIFITDGNGTITGLTTYGKTKTELVIPAEIDGEKITGIKGYGGTSFNKLIEKVIISDGVTDIGNGTFSNCTSLSDVTLPKSITNIGNTAFSGCSSLENVNFPESIENTANIGMHAFSNCAALININIPEGVTEIGGSAFAGCSNLTSLNIPSSVNDIDGQGLTWQSAIESINVDADNSVYCSIDGIVYTENVQTLVVCPANKKGSVTIPNSVVTIGDYAFACCSNLTKIKIPNSVTTIGARAIGACNNLTEITIPDSVTTCGTGALSDCESLVQAVVSSGLSQISTEMFSGCTNLTDVIIRNTFELDTVSQRIRGKAFYDCENLTNIYFAGTEATWNSLYKETDWDTNAGSATESGTYTVHYNYTPPTE